MSDQDYNDQGTPPAEQDSSRQQSGGVFIIKGMIISIPPGGFRLKISDGGKLEGDLTLHVGLDMCPYWLRIAWDHLCAADTYSNEVQVALPSGSDERLALALEKEFSSSMQAICSAAIALDAFYAMVKERIEIPQDISNGWRKKRTSRKTQIYEVVKLAFAIPHNNLQQIKMIIEQALGFRDSAVHPPSNLGAAVQHPELQKATEWRFVQYRFQNAKPIVGTVLSLIFQLSLRPKEQHSNLRQYCEGLTQSLSPLMEEWEKRYGILYERET